MTSRINFEVLRTNKSGESALPWGTPSEKTTFQLLVSLHLTAAQRLDKNEQIHRRQVTRAKQKTRFNETEEKDKITTNIEKKILTTIGSAEESDLHIAPHLADLRK